MNYTREINKAITIPQGDQTIVNVLELIQEALEAQNPSSQTSLGTETSTAVQLADTETVTLPANVVRYKVTAESGTFSISFNGGATQALTQRSGTREGGDGRVISNSNQIVITSAGDVDVIYETQD